MLEHTSSSGTMATNLLATESTLLRENSNFSTTTKQSTLNGSIAVTVSPYNDTALTLVLSTTLSSQKYSELPITVPTKSTQHVPEMSDRPTTTSNVHNNLSSSTEQPGNATQNTSNISVQPSTTALTNRSTSISELLEQTTPVASHQPNSSSSFTIHPISNTNLSSTTKSITQHISYTAQLLTTPPLINNQSSSTEQPRLYTSDSSAHNTTPHVQTIPPSSVTPAPMTSSKHGSSTADRASTMETPFLPVNTTRFHTNSTHLPDSITNSSAYATTFGVVSTKHQNMSSTAETVPTRGSTVTNSQKTETPVTKNANITIQSYTSNKAQISSSASVTNSFSPVEHSTKSPNETAQGLTTSSDKIVTPRSSISPPPHEQTEGTLKTTTTFGFQLTNITDSNSCRNIQCPSISVCVPSSSGYSCVTGKIFPGQLTLNSRTYLPEMANEKSAAFINTALEIENVFNRILKNQSGYMGSAVLKLMSGSVIANIENIFQRSSNVTSGEIAKAVEAFIEHCQDCGPLDKMARYKEQDLCTLNKCDTMTTICSASDGVFVCRCKEGLYKPFPSEQSCAACPSGYKLEDDSCVKCPFGYAGFNCDDSSLLAVVVISCVLGSLLLILLTSLYIACYRSKKLQREAYEHEAYLMWPKQEFPKIPRVTMTRESSQQEYGSKNILVDNEMSNGDTASPDASRTEGDLKTFSNKDSSRYSYLNHGETNPYFVNEDN